MRRKKLTETSPSTLKTNNQNGGSQAANDDNTIENVLVLQGGGSLGAFGCGVFKAIANSNIKLDIIAGTSIGGINAAIIAGSKDKEHPEEALERFWLELSESYVDLDKIIPPPSSSIPDFVEKLLSQSSAYFYDGIATALSADEKNNISRTYDDERDIRMRQFRSFYSSAIFGIEKMFRPRWRQETALSDPEFFTPQNWTYIYDHTPLVKTLENYINYDKLRPDGNPNSRLILTAVN
ncbi:MAG: patatin-like phospholipase family protein, partial [Nitrososphaeraceae archaeon]